MLHSRAKLGIESSPPGDRTEVACFGLREVALAKQASNVSMGTRPVDTEPGSPSVKPARYNLDFEDTVILHDETELASRGCVPQQDPRTNWQLHTGHREPLVPAGKDSSAAPSCAASSVEFEQRGDHGLQILASYLED